MDCANIGSPTRPTRIAQRQHLDDHRRGSDITTTADHFHFDWQSLAADGSVSARIASQGDTSPFAKAGVMLRATTDPGSPYFAALVTPGNGIRVQWRTATAGTTGSLTTGGAAPEYLRVAASREHVHRVHLERRHRVDAGAGDPPAPSRSAEELLAGLAVASHNSSALSTVTADAVAVTAAPSRRLARVDGSCADIGSPTPTGSESLSGSTWTINGGGGDIPRSAPTSTTDWQTLAGDGSVVARIASQTDTAPRAKAGVMLRATTDPGSPYFAGVGDTGQRRHRAMEGCLCR